MEPVCLRRQEPLFVPTGGDLLGQDIGHGAAQEVFRFRITHQHLRRQGKRKLGQTMIAKWQSDLAGNGMDASRDWKLAAEG